MKAMFDGIKRFVREEDGAAGVEYALLLAFVALVMVGFGGDVKAAVGGIWGNIVAGLQGA
ncbi:MULTISPECIES: Flp family type IVb pilin [unclassified Cupriavidus]|uniref:Flp family type IVb pilin n=1 Tax=unclassified Cupriavidus TaxID=2640874 RepID=UPI0010F75F26|nr:MULTISPECIES: Flp family type IVb pilin [unclassified Cupriavidus]MWL86447.1 Flp family type IVb pilin [Cupriavidus sp. SW-Y-13]